MGTRGAAPTLVKGFSNLGDIRGYAFSVPMSVMPLGDKLFQARSLLEGHQHADDKDEAVRPRQ